jgi:hypothetical protein
VAARVRARGMRRRRVSGLDRAEGLAAVACARVKRAAERSLDA